MTFDVPEGYPIRLEFGEPPKEPITIDFDSPISNSFLRVPPQFYAEMQSMTLTDSGTIKL